MECKVGSIITLHNGIDYIITYKIDVANNKYGLIISKDNPNDIKIGTFKKENNEIFFETTYNYEQALYILESIMYQTQ